MKKEYIIYKLSEDMKNATRIENELFKKFDVKRGLRNEDGTGVLVGLTKIGNVVGYERIPGGGLKPIPGKLFYRGYDLEDLAHPLNHRKAEKASASVIQTAVHVPASGIDTSCAFLSITSMSSTRMAAIKTMKPPKNINSER